MSYYACLFRTLTLLLHVTIAASDGNRKTIEYGAAPQEIRLPHVENKG